MVGLLVLNIPHQIIQALFVPQETEASSLIYTTGCIESLTNWINDNLHIVGGLAFGFAVIQVHVRGDSFLFHDCAKPGTERGRRREKNLSQNSVQTPLSV